MTHGGRTVFLPSFAKHLYLRELMANRLATQLPFGAMGVSLLKKENTHMLWTLFVILLVLWALGLVTAYTMGGLIHIFLVIALVVLVIQLLQGRRAV
jgi:hypothetical protein